MGLKFKKLAGTKRFELLLNGLEPFVLPLHQAPIEKHRETTPMINKNQYVFIITYFKSSVKP